MGVWASAIAPCGHRLYARHLARVKTAIACPLLALALSVAAPSPELARAAQPPPARTAAQQQYLTLAKAGIARAAERWRDGRGSWYYARLGGRERYPLARIWDIVPMFEALDAIAIAEPSRPNVRALEHFAAGAERYLNRRLRPVPGYSPYPGDHDPE